MTAPDVDETVRRIDDVGDVLAESPGKVAQSVLLFCQEIGLLTSANTTERLVSNSFIRDTTYLVDTF